MLLVQHGSKTQKTVLPRPGVNSRLYMSLTAGAGTRCMSLLSSSPSLIMAWRVNGNEGENISLHLFSLFIHIHSSKPMINHKAWTLTANRKVIIKA